MAERKKKFDRTFFPPCLDLRKYEGKKKKFQGKPEAKLLKVMQSYFPPKTEMRVERTHLGAIAP